MDTHKKAPESHRARDENCSFSSLAHIFNIQSSLKIVVDEHDAEK